MPIEKMSAAEFRARFTDQGQLRRQLEAQSKIALAKDAKTKEQNIKQLTAFAKKELHKSQKTIVGIDPSSQDGKFAVCAIKGLSVMFWKLNSFIGFLQWIKQREFNGRVHFVVENSNLQNITFGSSKESKRKLSIAAIEKISRNIGKNQQCSQATVDYLISMYGADSVTELSPKQKGAKWSEAFARGVAKGNNHVIGKQFGEDKRDAYQLALRGQSNQDK